MTQATRKYDEKYYTYLDALRESGATNMFGAGAYLQEKFDLPKSEALAILADWMRTFGQE
jgi:hypothetical protein